MDEVTKARVGDVLYFKGMGYYILVRFENRMCNLINLKTGAKKTASWKDTGDGVLVTIPARTRVRHLGGNPINYGKMKTFTVMEEKEVPVTIMKKVTEPKTVELAKSNRI